MFIYKYFPGLASLIKYQRADLLPDLNSGITVGVMLIPQGLAYAMLAGLPPIYGLYAAIVPLVVYALMGTSRQLAVGPAAMVSLLTLSGLSAVTNPSNTDQYIQMAFLLAFLVGVIQLLLGVFRLGFLTNFLSRPVILGFSSAAAIIIAISQLKHLFGIPIQNSNQVQVVLMDLLNKLDQINWIALIVGSLGIAFCFYLKKHHARLPSALALVIIALLATWLLNPSSTRLDLIGEIPSGLPTFAWISFDFQLVKTLLPSALAIALVSFVESITIASVVQARHKNYNLVSNQELLAMGVSKIAGAFFQAFPTTGGFSRTIVNDQAGARTQLSGLVSAGVVVLVLLFLTDVFYYLPKAVLSAIIIVAVYSLINFKEAKALWKTDRTDFWLLLATFLATLFLGIILGIGIGVLLSLGVLIYRASYPHHAELGRVPNTNFYRNKGRFTDVELRKDLLIMRFDERLYFANANHFKEAIEKYLSEREEPIKALILHFNSVNDVDSSAIHLLKELFESWRGETFKVYITAMKGPVRDQFRRAGLMELIGEDHLFMSVQNAVDAFDHKNYDGLRSYNVQSWT